MRPRISGGWAAEFCSECRDLTYTRRGSLAAVGTEQTAVAAGREEAERRLCIASRERLPPTAVAKTAEGAV